MGTKEETDLVLIGYCLCVYCSRDETTPAQFVNITMKYLQVHLNENAQEDNAM